MNQDCNLADLYFIFADNKYEGYVTYDKFKALINFYALLYDKVMIPDTYFINNHHLIRLMIEDDGLEYINRKIIVPTVRANTTSLVDVYQSFSASGTLINREYDSTAFLSKLEQIDLQKAITWKIDDISNHFTWNVLEHSDSLPLEPKERQPFFDHFQVLANERALTRQEMYHYIFNIMKLPRESQQTLQRYVDIHYNFNIPKFLGTSAAYPEKMTLEKTDVSPESVYFNQNPTALHQNLLMKEEFVETSLFNQGILSALTAEQISHIRTLKEYRGFLKALRKAALPSSQGKLEDRLFEYVYIFEKELPTIISNDIRDSFKKEKRKLTIQTLGRDTVSTDGVGQLLSLAVEGVTEFVGGKLIGNLVNILLKPLSSKTELEIKKLELQGQRQIAKLKTNEGILDTMKSFSINTLGSN
ncbi:hypothetical protein [Neobacillus sp. LXY-4]|uniref:hypothetical protein n=1 Tax=Neobacillus sp. LXY-4 TaxID=3379826 RepID=UPI003EE2B678